MKDIENLKFIHIIVFCRNAIKYFHIPNNDYEYVYFFINTINDCFACWLHQEFTLRTLKHKIKSFEIEKKNISIN